MIVRIFELSSTLKLGPGCNTNNKLGTKDQYAYWICMWNMHIQYVCETCSKNNLMYSAKKILCENLESSGRKLHTLGKLECFFFFFFFFFFFCLGMSEPQRVCEPWRCLWLADIIWWHEQCSIDVSPSQIEYKTVHKLNLTVQLPLTNTLHGKAGTFVCFYVVLSAPLYTIGNIEWYIKSP